MHDPVTGAIKSCFIRFQTQNLMWILSGLDGRLSVLVLGRRRSYGQCLLGLPGVKIRVILNIQRQKRP